MEDIKSNTQIKREWKQEIETNEKFREQDIRLRCLEMVMYHGPDSYKKGDVLYRIANRLYSYVKNQGNPDIKYENFM